MRQKSHQAGPAASYAIERAFDWDVFVGRYWDQQPVLYKGCSGFPFELADAFGAASDAGKRLRRAAKNGEFAKVARAARFTWGRRQRASPETWAPRASDMSFGGYHARIMQREGAERYALLINTLHAHSFALWSKERNFFDQLWRRVGLPVTGAITTLFHGNYESTPVGVHLDRFSTFLFALDGRKRMRFWRRRPWKDAVSSVLDYQLYMDTSFAIDVEAGDALYWPSEYYHVGENAGGGPATSVNVGIPRHEHKVQYEVEDLLVDLDDPFVWTNPNDEISRRFAETNLPLLVARPFGPTGASNLDMPDLLERVGRNFQRASTWRTLESRVRAVSLRRASSGGFSPVPSPARYSRPLEEADRVHGRPRSPILWSRAEPGKCVCAANGRSVVVDIPAKTLAPLLARLNSGRAVSIRELLLPLCEPVIRAEILHLLAALHGFRAIARLKKRALTGGAAHWPA